MKKNKIGIIVATIILNIPFSLLFSTLIHCKLEGMDIDFNVFKEIGLDKNYMFLFFLIFVLLETMIITVISMNKNNTFESSVDKIASGIETPVPVRTTDNMEQLDGLLKMNLIKVLKKIY